MEKNRIGLVILKDFLNLTFVSLISRLPVATDVDPLLSYKQIPPGCTCHGVCAGVRSTQINEFWPQLAEKAYAKYVLFKLLKLNFDSLKAIEVWYTIHLNVHSCILDEKRNCAGNI